MSAKTTSRPRKHRQKEEMKQEIVAQVHKTPKKEVSPDTENVNKPPPETTTNGVVDSGSDTTNKTYKVEDRNDNYSVHTPSREISVDGETQISSKILTLIETEMKRDLNKHSHFTDSRPQSLSFYEEEKIPEELSGNLELLSPEERKHYKKRKEHAQMDTDERNAYNSIQDLYAHDDEIINSSSSKRSKSRKKRHGDNEHGLGDSREMMIPKEKRKSKKKKRESSPGNGKRKHRRREEEQEVKGEVALALDELQDDVFETTVDEYVRQERVKRSPRRADKVYVQKKNRFEATPRTSMNGNTVAIMDGHNDGFCRRLSEYRPIELASRAQRYWLPFTTLCHGLLGGLGLAHLVYLRTNYYSPDDEYLIHYASFSDTYVCLFYFLCVICLISVYDRYDLGHLDYGHLKEMAKTRKSSVVILIYLSCMIVHLCTAKIDDKIGLLAYDNSSVINITRDEIQEWSALSCWRSSLAFLSWVIVGLAPQDDLLYDNLKSMEQFIPNN